MTFIGVLEHLKLQHTQSTGQLLGDRNIPDASQLIDISLQELSQVPRTYVCISKQRSQPLENMYHL